MQANNPQANNLRPDMAKLEALVGTVVSDLGAAANAALVIVGDKVGLFRALAKHGPQSTSDLAKHTGTHERYVREWLSAQAASGYVSYDAASAKFSLSPEQAMIFASDDSPVSMAGGFPSFLAGYSHQPPPADA